MNSNEKLQNTKYNKQYKNLQRQQVHAFGATHGRASQLPFKIMRGASVGDITLLISMTVLCGIDNIPWNVL